VLDSDSQSSKELITRRNIVPEPKVTLIANTEIDWVALASYVESVGGKEWVKRIEAEDRDFAGQETLVEAAGRLCYRSWAPDLNPNTKKVRTDSEAYLQNIINQGHGSVLEHVTFTFMISDVSRIFTHELVRHRVGTAISQESLRYVRLDKIPFRMPDSIAHDEILSAKATELLKAMEDFQVLAAERTGIDNLGVPFHKKKMVTSDIRRLSPEGVLTSIVWTANIRTLRDTILLRTSEGAEWEIRNVFDQIAQIVVPRLPNVFYDFSRSESGVWTSSLP
jgi:thymidylate synthase (FAD)